MLSSTARAAPNSKMLVVWGLDPSSTGMPYITIILVSMNYKARDVRTLA